MDKQIYLETKDVVKTFPGVKAIDKINLQFREGEVHAICGENGAGKSTLMNVLSGVYSPDEGSEILYKGKQIILRGPQDARNYGIAMIHQENSLVQHLTVYENIFLGHLEVKGKFVDKKKMYDISKELLVRLEIDYIDPATLVKDLSVSEKQLIEIAKAISLNPRLIIMDEPTAALTVDETNILMNIIHQLKQDGVSIVYISHHLEEIFEIADIVSVLRDGEHIGTYNIADVNMDKLISLMVGRKLSTNIEINLEEEAKKRGKTKNTAVVLSVKGLTRPGKVIDASFDLHKGEILGFAGLIGAGRSELMEMVYGHVKPSDGEIFFEGKPVKFSSPSDAVHFGIGMITEDRKFMGILKLHSVKDNINISILPLLKKGGLLSNHMQNENAEVEIKQLNVKTPSANTIISNLSGGNQQKALLGRMLSINPKILILDEPTHGIDVGAKAEIYNIINELAESGVSIILISSELPELIRMSHRIMVMHEGKIQTTLEYPDFNQETILNYASNIVR